MLDQVGTHRQEATVAFADRRTGRNALGQALLHEPRRGGLPDDCRIELAGSEAARDDLDVLVQDRRRRDAFLLEGLLSEAVGAAAQRHRDTLAVQPLDAFLGVLELWGIGSREEHVALVGADAQRRDDADIGDLLLGRRHDARHVAHVPDVLLACEHRVHDHGPLESNRELDGRSLRQVLLVQLLATHHDAGPRLRVVRLIADDQVHRRSRLSELEIAGDGDRRSADNQPERSGEARQRSPNTMIHAERHACLPF